MVHLLPYLEAEDRYKQLDREQGWKSARNQAVVSVYQKPLRCPSDHRPETEIAQITNYVGIAGVGDDAATLDVKHRRAGVFGYDRKTMFKDITDGTSSTILFVETIKNTGPWAAGGHATVRGVDPDDSTPIAKEGAIGIIHSDTRWNWGRIQVWANAGLADGSVRRLPSKTTSERLTALATIAGGEDVPADW
jgi:hypothetical protein